MSFKTNLRVFYVHGLEGHVNGSKGSYLSRFFRVHGIDMSIGMWSLKKDVNGVKYFFRRFFSRQMFTVFNWHNIAVDMLKSCVAKQVKELRRFPPDYFDVYIGSSWGGAVLLELLRFEGLLAHDAPVLLLSAAPYKIYGHSVSPKELLQMGRIPRWPASLLATGEEAVKKSEGRDPPAAAEGASDQVVAMAEPEEEGEVAGGVPRAAAAQVASREGPKVDPFDDDVPRPRKSKKKRKEVDKPFGFFPNSNMRAFRCVRVVHGSLDKTIPPRHATRICRVLNRKTKLYPIQGGEHRLGCLLEPCSDAPPSQPVPLDDDMRMPELDDRPVCEFEKPGKSADGEWGELWKLTRQGSLYWHVAQAYLASGLRERRVMAMQDKESGREDGA